MVLLGIFGYFEYFGIVLGHFCVLLGMFGLFGYLWVCLQTIGYYWILFWIFLGNFGCFLVLSGTFGLSANSKIGLIGACLGHA